MRVTWAVRDAIELNQIIINNSAVGHCCELDARSENDFTENIQEIP